ncbi:MAG: hypothetical protein K2I96_18385 [Lachnospiraceae bacterium]|nr:hypothetical protein [Lachnospiraceae bacterium]
MTAADGQNAAAGIGVRIQKPGKRRELTAFEVKVEKDIKQCMQCSFFYGSSRQCIAKECVKKLRQKETVRNSQCAGCPYRQSENYCFPCMKKILGGKKEEEKKDNDG